MASSLLLLNEFLPADALGLGWLAESLKTPTMDAYRLQKAIPSEDILRIAGQNFKTLLSETSSNAFRLSLTRLLANSNKFKNGSNVNLESVHVTKYQLRQPKSVFKSLVADQEARSWLNDCIQAGQKSYLVVELQTAMDPAISTGRTKEHSVDVDLTVPVSTIATSGMDALGLGKTLDSSIGGGNFKTVKSEKSFSMTGEQIFAIGYKRIVWKSFGLRKNLDKARLDDKITWSVFGEKRGSNEEEVIAADLADELDAKYTDAKGVEDDEDDDDDDEDELKELMENKVESGSQTYMLLADSNE